MRKPQKTREVKSRNIIKAGTLRDAEEVFVIGEELLFPEPEPECSLEEPPLIEVERNEMGQVSRIIVKCPCGREAELVCEYE